MKKYLPLIFIALLASCSSEEPFLEEVQNYEKRISVVASDLVPGDGTRTSYTETDFGYHFAWSEGDVLGIFPENGHQTDFPISNGYGTNTAVFDGGDWALKPNAKYAAYYPLVKEFELNPTAIPVDYTGQVQDGNNSTAHLGKYDYMATTFNQVDSKGNVNFELKHLGCLVQFKVAMPVADTYSSLEIVSDKTPFIIKGKFDLTKSSQTIAATSTSESITIGLENVSTSHDNEIISVSAMFAPVDLSGSTLSLIIKGEKQDYNIKVEGKNLQNSNAYCQNNSDLEIPYITFSAEAAQTLRMNYKNYGEIESLEYSVDNGDWAKLGTSTIQFGGANGNIRVRAKSEVGTGMADWAYSNFVFGENVSVECSGDIRTLVDWESYETADCSRAQFTRLFYDCKCLVTAPKLPIMTLAGGCYLQMFEGCTSLTEAPELPATTLSGYCYYHMFEGCTSLTSAPILPATEMKDHCYAGMFKGCSSLKTAPSLPATDLALICYGNMFEDCTSITEAPSLPATTLAEGCYSCMLLGTSINSIPEYINVDQVKTWLANGVSLQGMFAGLPITDDYLFSVLPVNEEGRYYLEEGHSEMFRGCKLLKTAPELPAQTVKSWQYQYMFEGCTSLTTAPSILPATTLAECCYYHMFKDCSSLTTAPELPALELAWGCYAWMFVGCTKLSYIKMMATDINADFCLSFWTNGVAPVGTFVKNAAATWDERSCIPEGWTVQTVGLYEGHEYVDLGLPSGTLWATCNIGASTPEGYGDYYAWGEIEKKDYYDWDNYKFGDRYSLTKYVGSTLWGEIVDNKKVLDLEDDVAYQKWGGNWRIPSEDQYNELLEECLWEPSTRNGIDGVLITSKKNDNSLFLPFSGFDNGVEAGTYLAYWLNYYLWGYTEHAWYIKYEKSTNQFVFGDIGRCRGHGIRPVVTAPKVSGTGNGFVGDSDWNN